MMNSIQTTLYEPGTGLIRGVLTTTQENTDLTCQANNLKCVEGAFDAGGYYIVDGIPTSRPAGQAVLTGATLTNLPNPCTITINSQVYQCDQTQAELSFDQPGTYKIVVSAFPYLDQEFTYVQDPA